MYSVVKSSEYVAKIQKILSRQHSSPENSMSITFLLPLTKSVGVSVFEWFLGKANAIQVLFVASNTGTQVVNTWISLATTPKEE